MKRCAHPNVVALLELSRIDFGGVQYSFIIEAFMSGGTLEDRLQDGLISPKPTGTLQWAGRQVWT